MLARVLFSVRFSPVHLSRCLPVFSYNSSAIPFSSSPSPSPSSDIHFEYNFSDMSLPTPSERLVAFRKALISSNIDCFIQGTNDAHQSEYVCERDKRIAFLSCFTGSAGTIVVTQKEALLWTDARYFISANKELSNEWTLMKQGLADTPSYFEWIGKHSSAVKVIGIDPLLSSVSFHNKLQNKLNSQTVVSVKENPIDQVWQPNNQPPMPSHGVFIHETKYSGIPFIEKVKSVQSRISEIENCFALIVTSLDHIAWLLNLRGNDIVYNPVFFSYAIVTRNDCHLYFSPSHFDEESKENDALKQHLKSVKIGKYCDFFADLEAMVEANKDKLFWFDSRKCNMAIYERIPEKQRMDRDDVIEIMKAVKNSTEIAGFSNCHVRDGAAKTRYFAWLNAVREAKEIEKYTEWDVAQKLLQFRKEADLFMDLSFQSISSAGPNGAIIHYAPTESDHCAMLSNDIYLIDSGAQYLDGTTDTTRTVWLGYDGKQPSDHHKQCYTRVLKGVIALSALVFPENTKGPSIDSVARSFLWQIGLDYGHGTGHGVGCFLNVHEGPHGFSASTFNRTLYEYGLKENMIITIEPGYYEQGSFGIRIENVMAVVKADTKHQFGGKQFLTFKCLTMVPIDTQLIDWSIMTNMEVEWLNEYHKTVKTNIMHLMKTQNEKDFLVKATQQIDIKSK